MYFVRSHHRRLALPCMKQNVNTIERAFELAGAGDYATLQQLRARLHAEGYPQNLVVGRHLSFQLRGLMDAASPRMARQVRTSTTTIGQKQHSRS
jgi:hypothetical protein